MSGGELGYEFRQLTPKAAPVHLTPAWHLVMDTFEVLMDLNSVDVPCISKNF